MMTSNKKFKKRVRDRMKKTGESFTTARRHLLAKKEPLPGGARTPPKSASRGIAWTPEGMDVYQAMPHWPEGHMAAFFARFRDEGVRRSWSPTMAYARWGAPVGWDESILSQYLAVENEGAPEKRRGVSWGSRRVADHGYVIHPIECSDGWVYLEHQVPTPPPPNIRLDWHGVTPPVELENELPYVTTSRGARWLLKAGRCGLTMDDIFEQFNGIDGMSASETGWLAQYGGGPWKTEQQDPLPWHLRVTWDDAEVKMQREADYLSHGSPLATQRQKRWKEKLPKYARKGDIDRILKLYCRSCGKTRWAELDGDQPYPGVKALRAGKGPSTAKCLFCGAVNPSYYNWHGRPDERI